MSLFNRICEGIITEIRAEDAYNRFYSSIPREDFDKIVGGEENIDKFIQFFLNCVRDEKATADEAAEAIAAYRGADQLVKQNVKNKVVSGEYEDVDDVLNDINYFSNGGGVVSKKSFAKKGYIKLAENDKWIATCTANYLANNHYYGNSHWCTASDRMGRYDGYRYFLDYTVIHDAALIQFKWKGEVITDTGVSGKRPDSGYLGYRSGFIGDKLPERFAQFQVEVQSNLNLRQMCDNHDYGIDLDGLKEFVGEDMCSVLEDSEKIKFCVKTTKDMYQVEKDYQDNIEKSLERKRKRMEEALNRKTEALYNETRQFTAEKTQLVKAKWEEFVGKQIYKDKNFIKVMFDRDLVHKEGFTEKSLSENYYAYARKNILLGFGKKLCIALHPVIGEIKTVERFTNDRGFADVRIKTTVSNTLAVRSSICVVYDYDGGEISFDKVLSESDKFVNDVYLVSCLDISDESVAHRFCLIHNASDDTNEVYDCRTGSIFSINFVPTVFRIADDYIIFFEERSDYTLKYALYNEQNGEIKPREENDFLAYRVPYQSAVSFFKDGCDYQVVYYPKEKLNGVKLYTKDKIENFYDSSNDNIRGLSFVGGGMNAFFADSGQMVFGFNGDNITVEADGECALSYKWFEKTRPNGNYFRECHRMKIFRHADGTYEKTDNNNGWEEKHLIPCDKYGRTERDIISDKNLEAWQKAGGYSPEVKAQMDKMWADRNGKDSDGSEAMKAWNDDDRMLDKNYKGALGWPFDMSNPELRNQLAKIQKVEDDPRWRGYMDLTDPVDGSKERKEKRPFIRIGKNGQPLDQPWYDEDEVPANLSDRPVPHGRVYEQYNTLISLMDRMGLLD